MTACSDSTAQNDSVALGLALSSRMSMAGSALGFGGGFGRRLRRPLGRCLSWSLCGRLGALLRRRRLVPAGLAGGEVHPVLLALGLGVRIIIEIISSHTILILILKE